MLKTRYIMEDMFGNKADIEEFSTDLIISKFKQLSGNGHFTILSFTTGYKAFFGTPNLDESSRKRIWEMETFDTVRAAVIFAIKNNIWFLK